MRSKEKVNSVAIYELRFGIYDLLKDQDVLITPKTLTIEDWSADIRNDSSERNKS